VDHTRGVMDHIVSKQTGKKITRPVGIVSMLLSSAMRIR